MPVICALFCRCWRKIEAFALWVGKGRLKDFQTAYKFVGQIFVFDIYHFIKITLLPLQSLLSHVV